MEELVVIFTQVAFAVALPFFSSCSQLFFKNGVCRVWQLVLVKPARMDLLGQTKACLSLIPHGVIVF